MDKLSDIAETAPEIEPISSEGLFGREKELADAGYRLLKDEPQPEIPGHEGEISESGDKPDTFDNDFYGLHAAANELAALRDGKKAKADAKTVDRDMRDSKTGEALDKNVAVSPEQAAREVTRQRGAEQESAEIDDTLETAADIDARRAERAEAIKQNPYLAEAYGVQPQEMQPKDQPIDGLDPKLNEALNHPQVREAIAQQFTEADAVKRDYGNAIELANKFARASLVDHFPELQNLPVEQWETALGILHQSDPQRVQRGLNVLQRVAQVSAAQARWQQQQAQVQQHQFREYVKAEDAKFDRLVEGVPKEQLAKVAQEVIDYAEELGVPRAEMIQLWETQPIMRSAPFQKMMVDAASYRMLQRVKVEASRKSLPPVLRPGVAVDARVSRNEGDIREAEQRFSRTASARDAVALLHAQRRARAG